MIKGRVDFDEAYIPLRVIGNKEIEIEAVLDTGFTSQLSLPPNVIHELGLKWYKIERSILADGSECIFDVYVAEVIWHGDRRRVTVDEADISPVIGMSLMKGSEVTIEVCQDGSVMIDKL